MAHVNHVRPYLVQYGGEGVIHGPVSVAVPGPRHVDDVQRDARLGRVGFPLHGVFRQKGVLLPGEDVHLVPLRERQRQAPSVDLRPGVVAHRVAVNHLEDFQVACPHSQRENIRPTPQVDDSKPRELGQCGDKRVRSRICYGVAR